MPYEVPNDVIMYHEKRIEWNILISACMPYGVIQKHAPDMSRDIQTIKQTNMATLEYMSVPLKRTWEVDLIKPLKTFIANTYSSCNPDDYSQALADFNKLRNNTISKSVDKHESALEVLYRWVFIICSMTSLLLLWWTVRSALRKISRPSIVNSSQWDRPMHAVSISVELLRSLLYFLQLSIPI